MKLNYRYYLRHRPNNLIRKKEMREKYTIYENHFI